MEQQEQLNKSIVNSLEQEVNKMNNFSMNIVYSNLVKEHFQKNLTPIQNAQHDPNHFANLTTLIDVILAIISSSETAKQANIYDLDGQMIGAGTFNGELKTDLTNKPWFTNTIEKDGKKHLSLLSQGQLPFSMRQKNIPMYIAHTRVYKDGNYVPQGIVEILQDTEIFFHYLNDLKKTHHQLQIFVFDASGSFIYPYHSVHDYEGHFYRSKIQELNDSPSKIIEVNSPVNGSKQLISHAVSQQTGWTVILAQSHYEVFSYLKQLQQWFFIVLILALIFTLIITYIVAKKVTDPLKQLQHAIKKMNLSNINQSDVHHSKLDEIADLNRAFNDMNHKLSQSLQELLHAKSQEMDAKFLALQSQMNPHFLYNNLTNISIMAEEQMNEEIIQLCNNISFMMRYISKDSKKGICLQSELEYTENYLECMKIRFGDQLSYSIDIPEELKKFTVPKLLVQPLIENSLKHGMNTSPPWHIHMKGYMDSSTWKLTITDNGLGFDPDIIQQLEQFISQKNHLSSVPDIEIGGMGLKNIYLRLKLMYGDMAIFEIEKERSQGASVTIGGSLHGGEM